jgi:hypothetical protein
VRLEFTEDVVGGPADLAGDREDGTLLAEALRLRLKGAVATAGAAGVLGLLR